MCCRRRFFEVADTSPEGVRVRRLSETGPLPEAFSVDEVRPLPDEPPLG